MLIRPNKAIEVPANPATISVALEIAYALAFKASPHGDLLLLIGEGIYQIC